ncbi:MAG TPA: hypothetical protein VHB77_19265 [Planctomycetaceae bacterium]|nr:hypothetical protein [Planctomycetaceae bacterium]
MRLWICVWAAIAFVPGCDTVRNPLRHVSRPLAKSAKFDLYLVSPTKLPGCKVATDPNGGGALYLITPPVISAADVAAVKRSEDTSDAASLLFKLTPVGARKLSRATAKPGKIAVEVDGKVLMTANVHAPLSEAFEVTGGAFAKDQEKWFRALTEESTP